MVAGRVLEILPHTEVALRRRDRTMTERKLNLLDGTGVGAGQLREYSAGAKRQGT